MDTALHVLSQIVGVLKVAITVGTVEMLVVAFVILVFVASIFGTEASAASLAGVRIRPVILFVHVVVRFPLLLESYVASLAFKRPLPVVQSGHVLSACVPGPETAIARVALKATHLLVRLEMEGVDVSQRRSDRKRAVSSGSI